MNEPARELDRRQFAARLAAGAAILSAAAAATGALDGNAAAGQEGDKAGGAKPNKPALPDAPKPAPLPFNPVAVQLELLVGHYPSERLTPEGLRIIAGKLAGQLAHSARLSSFPLTNADGPGFVFSAYRGEP